MWPYKIIFHLTEIILKANNTIGISEIWYRNSLKFNNIVFGKSDIDFTILLRSDAYYKKTQSQFRFLKKIFPILGEVNTYAPADLENLQGFFNYFELERDPELRDRFPKLSGAKNTASALVFILKMMRADKKNLAQSFSSRKKKWIFHFKQIGIQEFPENLGEFLNILTEHFNIPLSYLKLNLSVEPYIPLKDYADPQFLVYYPVDWLYHNLLNLKFNNNLSMLNSLPVEGQELLISQLSWELMGLTAQYRNIMNQKQFGEHIDNMIVVLNHLEHFRSHELSDRLVNLKSASLKYH